VSPDAAAKEAALIVQLALGSAILVASVLITGLGFWAMEEGFERLRPWLLRRPHRPKLIVMLCLAALATFGTVTASVWLWAGVFHALDLFPTLEACVYFALVTFTTLGFGDLLLPEEWRLLGGMAAANGLLNIGLLAALILGAGQHLRSLQRDSLRDDRP